MLRYKDFVDTAVGTDLLSYLRECIEINRDFLEGIQKLVDPESDEKLRGRNAQCRDLLSYIEHKIGEENDS